MEAVSREILVGISRRTCKMVELMSVVHRVPDFDPVNSVRRGIDGRQNVHGSHDF